MARLGVLRDEASLGLFLCGQTLPILAGQELPYLRFASAAVEQEDHWELRALEAEIDAWKLPRETRDASRQLGTRRLRALRNVAPKSEWLSRSEEAHHLIVFAIQSSLEAVPLPAALATWSYQALASVCAAALKLIRIGQDGIQRALRAACSKIPQTIATSLAVARDDAGCFSPLLEIASMRHERADERLFIS